MKSWESQEYSIKQVNNLIVYLEANKDHMRDAMYCDVP